MLEDTLRYHLILALAVAAIQFSNPLAALADEPEPPSEWSFSRGMSLRQIAREAYGSPAFSRMVELFNDVDPRRIPAGTVIRTPSFEDLFGELDLIPDYGDALIPIFEAVRGYRELLKEYKPLREAANGYGRAGVLELPANIKDGLTGFADSIARSVDIIELRSSQAGNVPRQTLAQFRQAESELRALATGSMDGYGYDEDMVFQRLANGLANAVAWSRE
jgi:hypothetical protein